VVNGVGTNKTGTTGWELESLHSEGEILIICIIDYEAVVDGLLQALGLIACWHQGAGLARCQALLDAGGLGQSFIVSLNVVDDDSPFALSVDGTKRPDVSCVRWAEVGLLLQGCGPLNGQLGVEVSYVSVEVPELCVVVLNSSLELVGWVLIILQAPGLGGVHRAGRRFNRSLVWCRCGFVGRGRLVVVSRCRFVVGLSWLVGWGRVMVGWWCMVWTVGTVSDSVLGSPMADADMGPDISRCQGHNDQ